MLIAIKTDKEPILCGESTPYATPRMGAALLTPGVDEFYEEECYVWCRLIENGTDWGIDVGGDSFVGSIPTWWGSDISEDENGLGIQWMLCKSHGYNAQVLSWALTEGLSPGQEFVVYCSRPRWYRCSYEYEEYDFDNEIYVIRREEPTISLRKLEQAITEVFDNIRGCIQMRDFISRARWTETRRMFLEWEYGGGFDSTWVQLRLVSTLSDPDRPEYFGHIPLACGRSDNDNMGAARQEALSNLKFLVEKTNSDIDLAKIPRRRCL